MTRTRSGALLVAGMSAVLALSGLTGCAPDTDSTWAPAQWPVRGRVLTALPEVPPQETITLAPQRIRNDSVRIDARWAYLPGAPSVNAAVEAVVREAIAYQSSAAGTAYGPQVFGVDAELGERGCVEGVTSVPAADLLGTAREPHTVVVCEIVHAVGSTFGQRLRVVSGSSAGVVADRITTLYTDVATGAVADGASLVSGTADLWEDVVAVARRATGGLSLLPVAPLSDAQRAESERALQDAFFASGELVVPLPAGFTAPELEGLAGWHSPDADHPVWVTLPRESYEGLLTDLGRVVADAKGPFTGPTTSGTVFDHTPCDLVPCMSLTFDDGPSGLTPGILDALRDQQSSATFFMLGRNAREHPETVRRVAAEGHEIGNHTWNHPDLRTLPAEGIAAELNSTGDLLRGLSGQPVGTFRPPYGGIDDRVLAAAGMPAILWSVDTRDWAGRSDDDLLADAIGAPQIGTIMLMHDIQAPTGRIVPRVLQGLRDRGFSLVTVGALFRGQVPGDVVRHSP